jgi:hypothetical protein
VTEDDIDKSAGKLPISDYVSALVASVVAKSRSLASIEHSTIKGYYNEVLFKDLLYPFLPSFLKIVSGKVFYRRYRGDLGYYDEFESDQQDVIVYDSRLLGPLIEMHGVGYIPIDAVIATVEVKYRNKLDSSVVRSALEGQQTVAKFFNDLGISSHFHSVLLFSAVNENNDLLDSFDEYDQVRLLCIPGAGCALDLRKGVSRHLDEEDGFYEATKAFIAVFVDNCRHFAELRHRGLTARYNDLMSHYIRTQRRSLSSDSET